MAGRKTTVLKNASFTNSLVGTTVACTSHKTSEGKMCTSQAVSHYKIVFVVRFAINLFN